MIPPDVASALRVALIESQTQAQQTPRTLPIAATQRISDVLSDIVPGQRIFAEIQGMQANGTYRALVGQREITLSLPFSAKAGDSLELEVSETDGKLTLSFVANRTEKSEKPQSSSVTTSFSRTGQLIADLQGQVDSPGKRAPPALLNGNQALILQMPSTGAELAPILKQALTESGVFYEAHQARWVAGQLPTTALRQEPQGRLTIGIQQPSNPLSSSGSASSTRPSQELADSFPPRPEAQKPDSVVYGNTRAGLLRPLQETATSLPASIIISDIEQTPQLINTLELDPSPSVPRDSALPSVESLDVAEIPLRNIGSTQPSHISASPVDSEKIPLQANAAAPAASHTNSPANSNESGSQNIGPLPANRLSPEISGIVQQQLDGLATQNFVWQGQAWAGQSMQWEISTEPEGQRRDGTEDNDRPWQTRVKLALPVLGGIDAIIRLQPGGVLGVSLKTESTASEIRLREAGELLEKQLAAAGLTLTQLLVAHEQTGD